MSRLRLNKIATPSPPAANKAELYYSSTLSPAAAAFIDESGNVCRVGGLTTKDYRLIKRTFFYNGTTSYTPTSGASALGVELIGGGGAGGGAAAGTASTNFGSGGGGGGGGGAIAFLTTNIVGAHAGTFAIGAGGTAGTTGANPGNNGGNTIFTDNANSVVAQANGGTGGASAAASALLGIRSFGGAGGTASGTPTEGVTGTTWQGEDGGPSLVYAPTVAATGAQSGAGGASKVGSGGAAIQASGVGNAGRKYGGGGAGSVDSASTTRVGGIGANGIMIVEEWA